jgi:hypothetical protein
VTIDKPATTPPAPTATPAPQQPADEVLSARSALRLLLALLALWTVFSALALIFFQDAGAATIGGGLEGGEGEAAQRLLGVHLFVLAPIYGLLAWDPQRFRLLLWVPYVAQGGVVLATLFDIITGERDVQDGLLPLIVASVFFVLLLYVTFASRQPDVTVEKIDASAPPAPSPSPIPSPEATEPNASARPQDPVA